MAERTAPAARRLARTVAALAGIATAGTLALAAAGSGAATAAATTTTSTSGYHVINLHRQFERALPHARRVPHPRAGIVPMLGTRLHSTAAAAGCTEPNCDLQYNGGAVQHNPKVYLLLWGGNWTNADPGYAVMYNMFSGLGTTHDYWSPVTRQYGDGSGNPGPSTFAGAWQDTNNPPDPVTPADLAAEADGFASFLGITDTADANIVVASQSGTCFSDGFGGSCGSPQNSGYCAWHSYSNEPFTNMPYVLDAAQGCGQNFINPGSAGTYDGFSIVAGHEYAETITDPQPPTGWLDTSDGVSGGEIGDKCAWGGQIWGSHDPDGDITLPTGKFAMQSLWSNAAGKCAMSNDTLRIAPVSRKVSIVNRLVRYQMHATSSVGSVVCCWSARGLPRGARITSHGLITGRPSRAGRYVVTVAAKDSALSRASTRFTWIVRR